MSADAMAWARRIVKTKLANVLRVIDSIPCHAPHFPQWRMARMEAENAALQVEEVFQMLEWRMPPEKSAVKSPAVRRQKKVVTPRSHRRSLPGASREKLGVFRNERKGSSRGS